MIWTLLWKYKAWVALAAVIIAAGLYVSYLKISHNLMEAKLTKVESSLEEALRSNEILTKNVAAVAIQNAKMNEIAVTTRKLQSMLKDIKPDTRKVLNEDENIVRLNNCVAAYVTSGGVLPEGCDAVASRLPAATSPSAVPGR